MGRQRIWGGRVMGRIEWGIMVLGTWFIVEAATYLAFGWKFDWDELGPIMATIFIAWFTFPQQPRESTQ